MGYHNPDNSFTITLVTDPDAYVRDTIDTVDLLELLYPKARVWVNVGKDTTVYHIDGAKLLHAFYDALWSDDPHARFPDWDNRDDYPGNGLTSRRENFILESFITRLGGNRTPIHVNDHCINPF